MTPAKTSSTAPRLGRSLRALCACALVASTLGANEGGCGQGLQNRPGEPGLEVGGLTGAAWQLTYGDSVEVTVKGAAGAVVSRRYLPWGAGGTFQVGGVNVDLRLLCSRSDVVCPADVLPTQVRFRQPGADLHYLQVSINNRGPLGSIRQTVLPGNVDSDHDYSVFLGVDAAAAGTCGLLAVSYATGHITADPRDTTRGIALTGDIVTGYSAGCVVAGAGGAAVAGLTVELRQPVAGARVQ